jgi:hypothetical protein
MPRRAEQRLRDFLIGRFGGPQTYIEQRGHPRTPNLQKLRDDFSSNTPGVFGSVTAARQNPLHARGLCGNSAHSTYRTMNVIPSECNPNLADPPGLWVIIPFRFGSLLDSHRTVDVQIRFRSNCPINETSVGNDDPSQTCTSLAVCAKWLVIDRRARYMRCLRESLREQQGILRIVRL